MRTGETRMSIKSFIKNDLWRFTYIYPFAKKHLADEKGKADLLKNIAGTYKNIHAVKGERPRTVGGDTKALLGKVKITIPESGFVYFVDTSKTLAVPGNVFNNFTLNYSVLVNGSFNERLSRVVGNGTPDDEYGRQIKLVAEGIECLRVRIVEELKKTNCKDKKSRLSDFENILSRPASSFEEGLQRVLFFNQLMWQTRHRLNGLGRMDKYLWELYERDIKTEVLTSERADKLLDDFFMKLTQYSDYKADALAGDIGQIIVLGGLSRDGTYHCNELTEKLLRAQARVNVPDPKTLLRVSGKMPPDLMKTAVECLESATGSPIISNDDVIIPLLVDFGYEEADAYEYCVSACWEPYIPGKAFEQNNMATFDFSLAFDKLMSEAEQLTSFNKMVERYVELNQKEFSGFLEVLKTQVWARDPFVSFMFDECNAGRKDISEGGAKYSNYGITTVAIANVTDSLFNIRKLVFEDKKKSLSELADMRSRNFEGSEDILQFCRNHKYFGTDNEEAAELVNRITSSVSEVAVSFRNKYGGTVKFGLSSPGYNDACKKMPGDFSGRKAGEPYNTHISCTGAGYTEVVNFSGQLDYDNQRFNGNVNDFFVSPDFLRKNHNKFASFMLLAIKNGFFEMQMNIMDSKTLIDAKAHPEKYPGLIVRVWGMSAYFNDLPESYKNLLIDRAIAAERAA